MTDMTEPQKNIDSQVLLSQLAMEFLREKKRRRRFNWLKGVFVFLLIGWFSFLFLSVHDYSEAVGEKSHVGLIDIKGLIMADEAADADSFSKSMKKAYANKSLKALILRIDSPGGSPVQADYMYNTIKYYRGKYQGVKIYAVCVDTCASAAYYIAAAADEIYANPSSLVGSIGVLYNGFGFVDTLQKLGVTRRLQTAGRNKGFLDQFSPVVPAQEQFLQTMLGIIHQEFINKVKAGRGSRLLIDDDTFSGLFWTGVQAKQRGLIDGFASTGELARDVIKLDKIVDYSYKETPFEKMAKKMGVAMMNQLPKAFGMKAGFQ
jgi:protease-4